MMRKCSFSFTNRPIRCFHQPFNLPEMDRTLTSIHTLSSNRCSALLGHCRNIDSLKKVHTLLIVHGLTGDRICGKLVNLYGSFGDVGSARSVFDRTPNPEKFSWKAMLRKYFLNGLYSEIVPFYNCSKKCLREEDNAVLSIVLKACCRLRDINGGRKVHCHIVKLGGPDSFVLTSLVDMYTKCGEIECARKVFDEMPNRDVVSWTSMIVGYVQNHCPGEGLVLFNRMRESVKCNQSTLGCLVAACAELRALHQGKWVHGYAIKNGYNVDSFVATSLLDMYVKCGDIRDARFVINELPVVDVVSWTAMIVGYSQTGRPSEALSLFRDERWAHLIPNSATITSVVLACAQLGNLSLGRMVHCQGIKLGIEDHSVRNALVYMYAKCKENGDAQTRMQLLGARLFLGF